MKINRDEHPFVKLRIDEDDMVHVVDKFGDPWCEDDVELIDDIDAAEVGRHDLCLDCRGVADEEELFTDG